MGGITDHARASRDEAIQWLAAEQRPLVGYLEVLDDGVDFLVPSGKGAAASLARAALGPGFHRPVLALEDADEVEQLAAADRIGDDMAAGADPVGADVALHVRRQALHRHQATPGGYAGEEGLGVAADLPADFGMHAVGADDDSAAHALAVCELQLDATALLLETDAAAIYV